MDVEIGRHAVLWLGITAIGVVATGAGLLLLVAGLDSADKLSSVIGAACGVLGLLTAGLGAWRKSHHAEVSAARPDGTAGGQLVSHSVIRGSNIQIGSVGGDVEIKDLR